MDKRKITDSYKHEERFRTLLESVPDALVFVNSDGLIFMVNRQAEKLFGYSREELRGKRVEMLMPERFREIHLQSLFPLLMRSSVARAPGRHPRALVTSGLLYVLIRLYG